MKVVPISVVLATTLSITGVSVHAMSLQRDDFTSSDTVSWHSADAHQTWTRGTVVRVSVERGKITIEHEPIENLDMMSMTMPFTASDPALLEGLAAGDAVEFVADKDGDALIVTALRRPAS